MKTKILASLIVAAGIATLGSSAVNAATIGGIQLTGSYTAVNENTNNPTFTLGPVTSVTGGTFQFSNTIASGVNFIPGPNSTLALTGGTTAFGSTFYNFPSIAGNFLTVSCSGAFANCNLPNQVVTASNLIGVSAANGGAVRSPAIPNTAYTLSSTLLNVTYTEPNGLIVPGTISYVLRNTGAVRTYSITIEKLQNPNMSVPEPSAALGLLALGTLGLGSAVKSRIK